MTVELIYSIEEVAVLTVDEVLGFFVAILVPCPSSMSLTDAFPGPVLDTNLRTAIIMTTVSSPALCLCTAALAIVGVASSSLVDTLRDEETCLHPHVVERPCGLNKCTTVYNLISLSSRSGGS
ncbi:hypothetical protein B0H10DRAFT_2036267 [Mycena sp. CBHHK59/15]|nr:hypothetical protein B0H10DRAFT_2036267 [Mycena sp. CBHHK59/15]